MNKIFLSIGIAGLCALATVIPSHAADSTVSASDAKFAIKAAVGGMMEVKMGEVAQRQGGAPEIKEFGALMVTDHGKAGEKLKAIAVKEGLKLPAKLPAKKQTMIDSMAKMSGAAFDKAYVADMVADHRKDVAEFKMAAKNTSDPDLKKFAEDTLTVIEGHLQKIEAIQATMK